MVNPLRPLEPPVAEQLRVVGRNDGAREGHTAAGATRLLAAAVGEVAGVTHGGLGAPIRIIKTLILCLAGDSVILDAGVLANALGVLVGFEIFRIQFKANVTIVFAIIESAG